MIFRYKKHQCSFFLLFIIFFINSAFSIQNNDSESTATINYLLPAPQVIEQLSGEVVLTNESVIYFNINNKEITSIVSSFLELLKARYHLCLTQMAVEEIRQFQITIKNKNPSSPDPITPDSKLKKKGSEAYEIVIYSDCINIEANSSQGVRWAFMTMIQLGSKGSQTKLKVPAIKILDWPRYRWRGYMLDTGRAPYSVEQIKRTIRLCSAFKLNFLILREGDDELNAIKYDHLPLGHNNPYALTIRDLAEIIDYGENYGIVVFPEIESLGHAAAKRHHYPDLIEGDMFTDYWPGFAHMRKANLKVGDPGTYQLLESIYKELFPLLKKPLVHLGLDEVRLPREEQTVHMRRLLPIVNRVGSKNGHEMEMIVWSDAPLTPTEYQDRVIRCLWVYDDSVALDNQYARMQGIDTFIQAGCRQKVFMAGGSGTAHQPYSKGTYQGAFRNLASWTRLGQNYPNFIGILAVQWGTNIIDEWFPNFLMAADFGWKVPDETLNYESFMKHITTNLQQFEDFIAPHPSAVDRPAWDGIWLNGRYWDEDIITGQKAAPVVEITPKRDFFFDKSSPIEIISNFPNAKIYYTMDGNEPTSESIMYYEPFRVSNTTTVRAKAFLSGRPASYPVSQIFTSLEYQDPHDIGPLDSGLNYDYYLTDTYSALSLSDKEITTSGIADKIVIAPCATGEEKFGFVFTGKIKIPKKDVYTFYLLSNDGSKLYVNNREIIDNDGRHGPVEKLGKMALKVGYYPIKIMYFQNGGGQALALSWSTKWLEKQEVPPEVLFHDE